MGLSEDEASRREELSLTLGHQYQQPRQRPTQLRAFHLEAAEVESDDQATHDGVAGVTSILTITPPRFDVNAVYHTDLRRGELPTSASAFRCLATSSNGVNTWGYGIFFRRAAHFAVRHCRVAGGVDCRIAYCR
jgi:hypothetical protein